MAEDYAWTTENKRTQYCPNCEKIQYTYGHRFQNSSTNNRVVIYVRCAECDYKLYTVDSGGMRKHG